jgi:glycerol-3-phosphate O-acyltransferase
MAGATDDDSTELAKLGLEVMYRISQVTPITPAAVLSIVLLEAGGKAQTLTELAGGCADLVGFIARHALPTTEPLRLESPDEVRRVLVLLAEHGNVSTFAGAEPVYFLDPGQALAASYYRNMVAHHFLPRSLAELAMAGMGQGTMSAQDTEFWARVAALRDLLKFEFFFPDKESFRRDVTADLEAAVPGWRRLAAATLQKRLVPGVASWAVLPFLHSYQVVADQLVDLGDNAYDEKAFIGACLRRGEEYRLKGRISPASVSTILFRQALGLAANRGLIEPGPDLARLRHAFADEIQTVLAGSASSNRHP